MPCISLPKTSGSRIVEFTDSAQMGRDSPRCCQKHPLTISLDGRTPGSFFKQAITRCDQSHMHYKVSTWLVSSPHNRHE